MVKAKTSSKYVEVSAGASGIPHPRIAGTRIRVSLLVGYYKDAVHEGKTDEEAVEYLAESYPHLSRDEIVGALEYWRAHEEEIDLEIRRDEVMSIALEMQQRSLEIIHKRK
jgi:uncharacterized protein (DUF433 family)